MCLLPLLSSREVFYMLCLFWLLTWEDGLVDMAPPYDLQSPGGEHDQEVQPIVVVPQVGCLPFPEAKRENPGRHLQPATRGSSIRPSSKYLREPALAEAEVSMQRLIFLGIHIMGWSH